MCVQDIKIGRHTEYKGHDSVGQITTGLLIEGPDAARIAISMAMVSSGKVNAAGPVVLYTETATGRYPLAAVGPFSPSDRVTIADVGQPITGELFLLDVGGIGSHVLVGTTRLLVDTADPELRG